MKTLDEALDYFDGDAKPAHAYGPSIEEIVSNEKIHRLAKGLLSGATDRAETLLVLKEAIAIGVMVGSEMEKPDDLLDRPRPHAVL